MMHITNRKFFPRADYYSDEMNYDPLEIIISEGHKAKLSVHSWINPSDVRRTHSSKNWIINIL